MRVALISDVHGCLTALEAVLGEAVPSTEYGAAQAAPGQGLLRPVPYAFRPTDLRMATMVCSARVRASRAPIVMMRSTSVSSSSL